MRKYLFGSDLPGFGRCIGPLNYILAATLVGMTLAEHALIVWALVLLPLLLINPQAAGRRRWIMRDGNGRRLP